MRFLFFLGLQCLAVKRTRGDGGGINVATGAWRGQAGADTDKGHETKPGAGEQKRSCGQEGEVEEEKEVSSHLIAIFLGLSCYGLMVERQTNPIVFVGT